MYYHESGNVNEVTRAVLNFFLLFYKKILSEQKTQKAYKRTKTKKAAFFCAYKTSNGRKVAYSLVCVFVLFVLFVRAKSFRKKKINK